MSAEAKASPSLLLLFAVLCEVLAVVLSVGPTGSLAAPAGVASGLGRSAVILGLALAVTALARTALPGPTALFVRRGSTSLGRSLYYGVLAAVILTFFRAALTVGLELAGTTFLVTLPAGATARGPTAAVAVLVSALAFGYLFFGYVQSVVGGALGRRPGLIAAAALAAVALVWPAAGPSARVGGYAAWAVFVAWRLPEALALAYLAERVGNVLAPLAAIFLLEWFTAVGAGIFVFFGKWPFLFACLVIILAAAEVAVGERRRLARAVAGFFRLLFGRAGLLSFVDAVLFTLALSGAYALAHSAGIITGRGVVAPVTIGVLYIAAVVLWLSWRRREARSQERRDA